MSNIRLESKIIIRNDTKANLESVNPILLKGEMVIEIDTKKFKFGDGVTHWKDLGYASIQPAVISTSTPSTTDVDYDIGTTWINTSTNKAYILLNIVDGSATWKQMVTPEDLSDLGAGDMLKAEYATNSKSGQGYVDKAILADNATTANKVNHTLSFGSKTFDGSSNQTLTASDIGALTSVPDTYVQFTNIASNTKSGVVKSTAKGTDTVTVNADGTMTMGKASSATLADSASKLANSRKISITGDASGSATFDGSADINIATTLKNSGVTAGSYSKVTVDSKGIVTAGTKATVADIMSGSETLSARLDDIDTSISNLGSGKQDNITGAASTITSSNLEAGKVVVSNSDGKIAVSNMEQTTLEGLPGRIDILASSVDNIPKYNYLTGVTASVSDSNISNQTAIDNTVIPIIRAAYSSPSKWDAVVAGITFTPSDNKKDAVYYYNGTSWVFLYYVSTGINRANGTTAGIVENSNDITFIDGQGTVVQAGKVKHTLTIGGKTFDGSTNVEIESSDFITILPVATASTLGAVKSSSNINEIYVNSSGIMSLNTVAVAKLDLNGDTLILDGGNA